MYVCRFYVQYHIASGISLIFYLYLYRFSYLFHTIHNLSMRLVLELDLGVLFSTWVFPPKCHHFGFIFRYFNIILLTYLVYVVYRSL
jgi:hypothetical protein